MTVGKGTLRFHKRDKAMLFPVEVELPILVEVAVAA